jgi:hypothetical protein
MRLCAAIAFVLGLTLGIGGMLLVPHGAPDVVSAQGKPSGNGDVNGDEKINIADAIYTLSYLFAEGPAPEAIECAGGLLATGQTKCYDTGGAEIDCTSADFPGQDGFYQKGCPTADRFVDNRDGTVTDRCTNLMWQKDTAAGAYSWQEALQYCEGLELGGHDDWRLPNLRELASIVEYGRVDPSIDPIFGAGSLYYWSSTTHTLDAKNAWRVYFSYGFPSFEDKLVVLSVRAVRG